jgi:hypothetical protein
LCFGAGFKSIDLRDPSENLGEQTAKTDVSALVVGAETSGDKEADSSGDAHRVYVSFMLRSTWYCQFLEEDLKTPLRRSSASAAMRRSVNSPSAVSVR